MKDGEILIYKTEFKYNKKFNQYLMIIKMKLYNFLK
jgi:hypothetical protein